MRILVYSLLLWHFRHPAIGIEVGGGRRALLLVPDHGYDCVSLALIMWSFSARATLVLLLCAVGTTHIAEGHHPLIRLLGLQLIIRILKQWILVPKCELSRMLHDFWTLPSFFVFIERWGELAFQSHFIIDYAYIVVLTQNFETLIKIIFAVEHD